MKILFVNKFLYPRGGAESYMMGIGDYFSKTGHEVQYFGMFDEKNTVGNKAGIYTSNMDFRKKSPARFLYPFKIIYSFEAKRKIGEVLDSMHPDVVHLNNINFQLTPAVIDAAKKRKIPVVWTLHDYQLICPNHLLYNSDKKCVCEKCIGKSKVHCIKNKCIHASGIKSLLGTLEAFFYKIKGTYKKTDLFIVPSDFLYAKLIADNKKLFENRTEVLHNFVAGQTPSKNLKSKFPFPYIAFAGRLSEEKGTRILKEAAKLMPETQFVVMGSGEDEEFLKEQENIHLTGFITGQELTDNIACARAVAVPSVCFENCPMVILEAQMLSVPAVTMNMGGMAELVENGQTGILAKSVNPCAFAAATADILSDGKRLEQMKENCKRQAEKLLTVDKYCDKILSLYKRVIKDD